LFCIQYTAAAIQNIILTVYSLGLGSCWIGAFKEDEVRQGIKAPKGMRPVALVPVGYPNEAAADGSRRLVSEIMHKETF
jgi:nitroreductase